MMRVDSDFDSSILSGLTLNDPAWTKFGRPMRTNTARKSFSDKNRTMVNPA
jgi:hypothetical protein